VPAALAVALPGTAGDDLLDQAACLGIAGITGYRALFADGPVRGLTVLVQGAAGGVGSIATQMAVRDGYSSDAQPAIPYWTLGFADTTLRLLGSDDFPPPVKLHAADELTAALLDGALRIPIAQWFPLGDIAAAHEQVERGTVGRVLVRP